VATKDLKMGDVLCTFRVMPEGVDVDLEKIKKTIQEKVKPEEITEEPLAFGLKALIVKKVIPDKVAGGTDAIEKDLREVPGVQNVEDAGVTLIN